MQDRRGFKPPINTSEGNRQIEILKAAVTLHQQGNLSEARNLYKIILDEDRNNFDALHFYGLTSFQLGDLDRAISSLSQAVHINSGSAPLLMNYGVALQQAKRYTEALQSYNDAIAINSDYADALYNRANLFYEMRRFDEALLSYDQAISKKPYHADAYYNRGNTLRELNRFSDALKSYDNAISMKPESSVFLNNRGVAFQELLRFEDALHNFDQAILFKPDYHEAFINRGNVLKDMRCFEEAWSSYDKAMLINPMDGESYWNAGLLKLLLGNFLGGFQLYEWRKHKRDPLGNKTFHAPLWGGTEDLANKTILIHWEQGLGDSIQFCRYLHELTAMGANVLFAPQKSLKKIMSTLDSAPQIVDADDKSLWFDFHCPLLSLPFAFKTQLATIPDRTPYLLVENDLIMNWKKRIGPTGFKIGICWQGSTGKVDVGRSFPVGQFESLSRIPGVRLISLHKGEGENQLHDLPEDMIVETFDLDGGFDAFVDTAAVIKCCDLVISSDTAVAHLAGALGAKIWVALRYMPDWRWMLDRNDSPWYPTMRLFRQNTLGDWDGVFSKIRDALLMDQDFRSEQDIE